MLDTLGTGYRLDPTIRAGLVALAVTSLAQAVQLRIIVRSAVLAA